jgi:hypothetical protein
MRDRSLNGEVSHCELCVAVCLYMAFLIVLGVTGNIDWMILLFVVPVTAFQTHRNRHHLTVRLILGLVVLTGLAIQLLQEFKKFEVTYVNLVIIRVLHSVPITNSIVVSLSMAAQSLGITAGHEPAATVLTTLLVVASFTSNFFTFLATWFTSTDEQSNPVAAMIGSTGAGWVYFGMGFAGNFEEVCAVTCFLYSIVAEMVR